jgi:hypothetical protein
MDEIGCTDCHRASMPIAKAILTVMTPPAVPADAPCPAEVSSLINPASEDDSLTLAKTDAHIEAALTKSGNAGMPDEATPAAIYATMQPHLHEAGTAALAEGNYQIDLSLRGVAHGSVPAYVWPRLPADANNSVDVPLFSDLKVHFMGKMLSDDYPQPVDVAPYAAQPGHYVTRVLWGVGDSDPYLHDGRARSLREAIALHGVPGSEAAPAAAKFAALGAADQQAVIDFLESLRLPIAEGVAQPEYASN